MEHLFTPLLYDLLATVVPCRLDYVGVGPFLLFLGRNGSKRIYSFNKRKLQGSNSSMFLSVTILHSSELCFNRLVGFACLHKSTGDENQKT